MARHGKAGMARDFQYEQANRRNKMTLTIITKSGRKYTHLIASAYLVKRQLELMPMITTEPVIGYTLLRDNGSVEDVSL
jgi:hypothetical protein